MAEEIYQKLAAGIPLAPAISRVHGLTYRWMKKPIINFQSGGVVTRRYGGIGGAMTAPTRSVVRGNHT